MHFDYLNIMILNSDGKNECYDLLNNELIPNHFSICTHNHCNLHRNCHKHRNHYIQYIHICSVGVEQDLALGDEWEESMEALKLDKDMS